MGIVGCEQLVVGGKIVGRRQLAVSWLAWWREMRSIVRGANGSMLAVASRSIARFALLEYLFAVEDGRGWGLSAECYGSGWRGRMACQLISMKRFWLFCCFAIRLSSQELKKEHNFMPCGARYSHSRSDTPFLPTIEAIIITRKASWQVRTPNPYFALQMVACMTPIM